MTSIPRKTSLKKYIFQCPLWGPDDLNFWPSFSLQLHITFISIKQQQSPAISIVACSSHTELPWGQDGGAESWMLHLLVGL